VPSECCHRSHLHLVLFEAERAWSQSQLLKLVPGGARTKHHTLRRLLRAVQHAQHLVELLESPAVSAGLESRVEATTYLLLLRGDLAFEGAHWASGLNQLSVARDLLTHISQRAPTAHSQALANEWLDDVEPIARYCAYQLGQQGDIAQITRERVAQASASVLSNYDALVDELKASRPLDDGAKDNVDVDWRGRQIPVRNAELADITSKVKAVLSDLTERPEPGVPKRARRKVAERRGLPARFDKALTILGEAEEVSRRLVEDNQVRRIQLTCRLESSSGANQLASTGRIGPIPFCPFSSGHCTSAARPLIPLLPVTVR
jgi:signal recognition particle subunit SRP68